MKYPSIAFAILSVVLIGCSSKTATPPSPAADSTSETKATPTAVTLQPVDQYKSGDTLYVFAKSGLVLRDKAGIQGSKLASVGFTDFVVVKDKAPFTVPFETIEPCGFKIKGHWVEVDYQGKSGYLFDGFLLNVRPKVEISHPDYWSQYSIVKTSIDKAPESDEAIFFYANILWENGVQFINQGLEGSTSRDLTLPGSLFDLQSTYVWATATFAEEKGNPVHCECDSLEQSVLCSSKDERYLLSFGPDGGGNFHVSESFAD